MVVFDGIDEVVFLLDEWDCIFWLSVEVLCFFGVSFEGCLFVEFFVEEDDFRDFVFEVMICMIGICGEFDIVLCWGFVFWSCGVCWSVVLCVVDCVLEMM